MSTRIDLSRELKKLALDAGFDLAGMAGVADTAEHRFFSEWIADGRAGEMKYLEARNEANELKRASLANAAPWARSGSISAGAMPRNASSAGTSKKTVTTKTARGEKKYPTAAMTAAASPLPMEANRALRPNRSLIAA